MDLCGIAIGSLCLLVTTEVLSVKMAYPVEDQGLTNVCLTKCGKYIVFCFYLSSLVLEIDKVVFLFYYF